VPPVIGGAWGLGTGGTSSHKGKFFVRNQDHCVRACWADKECAAWNYHPFDHTDKSESACRAAFHDPSIRDCGHCWVLGDFDRIIRSDPTHQRENYSFAERCITFRNDTSFTGGGNPLYSTIVDEGSFAKKMRSNLMDSDAFGWPDDTEEDDQGGGEERHELAVGR
jgi:hypothetical protein